MVAGKHSEQEVNNCSTMPLRLLTNRFKCDSFQPLLHPKKKKYQSAYKPGFVPMGCHPQCMAIHLEPLLPRASRNQPGRRTENSPETRRFLAAPIRSCSGWGLPCQSCCQACGALLPHRFTLTEAMPRQFIFCGTFPEVSLAGRYPAPYFRGARTFLPCTLSGLARAAIQPTGDLGVRPRQRRGQ
jgi:hypothetical protein